MWKHKNRDKTFATSVSIINSNGSQSPWPDQPPIPPSNTDFTITLK